MFGFGYTSLGSKCHFSSIEKDQINLRDIKMGKDISSKMMVAKFVLSKEGMILNGKGRDMTSNLLSCTLMA